MRSTADCRVLTATVRRLIDTPESEVTLLHVAESQPWLGRNGRTVRLMSELELFAHRQFREARICRRIEWGRPADSILNVIRAARMDAVFLSAGDSARHGGALGPIAMELLAHAPCPVVLEWAAHAPATRTRPQPVCCAIEFDGSEEDVLREATAVAARLQAPLKLTCALSPALFGVADRDSASIALRARMTGLRDRWAPDAEMQIGAGLPASVFSRAIRFHRAGLLVAGGSGEALLAAHSQCPALYVGPAMREALAARPAEFIAGKTA